MYNQFVAVGEETNWGTAVARAKFAKVHEGSGLDHISDLEVSTILSGNAGGDAETIHEKGQRAEGKIVLPSSYDDTALFKIFKHGFGLLATSGAGPYVHTFTRKVGPPFAAGVTPTAQGLSLELNYDLPDTGPLEARLIEGAMVNTIALSWVATEEVKAEIGVIGEQMTQISKTASPTFPTYDTYLMRFYHATLSVDGSGDVGSVATGFTFNLDNGYQPVMTLAANTTARPRRKGKAKIGGTISLLWDQNPTAGTTAAALGTATTALTLAAAVFNNGDLIKIAANAPVYVVSGGGTTSVTISAAQTWANAAVIVIASSLAKAIWDKYKAKTPITFALTVVGPTTNNWVLTLTNVVITKCTLSPEEGQAQAVDFEWTALHNATNTAAKLVCTSSVVATV